jgi:hypothetical protein
MPSVVAKGRSIEMPRDIVERTFPEGLKGSPEGSEGSIMAKKVRERDSQGDGTGRSRRQLLAGAAGALGAIAAAALVKATPAEATQGMPIIAGQLNDETGVTTIHNTSPGYALHVVAGAGTGVISSGIDGGTYGYGDIGVEGAAAPAGPNRLGVRGLADGVSGGTSVIGLALDGSGVVGKSVSGSGVYGVAGTYTGASASGAVVGDATTSAGVVGFTSAPSRAAAEFTHVGGKTALKVTGLSVFSRSGKVAIKNTAKAATVTGVPLTASSLILATVQNSLGVWVASAVPNVPGSSFTINLNAAPGTGYTAQVAWFVVN